jgi:hypothetical protein
VTEPDSLPPPRRPLDIKDRPKGDGSGHRTAIGCSILVVLALLLFWVLRGLLIG